MTVITAQPRSIRYIILVDGDVAQANGRRVDALKRAIEIHRTWLRSKRIELVDSWNVHERLVWVR